MNAQRQSLTHHMHDLRRFLWRSIWGVLVCTAACGVVSRQLLAMLTYPIQQGFNANDHLVVLSVYEYIITQLKTAVLGGFLLATPWVLYQLWQFVAPGLYRDEKRLCIAFTTASSLCAMLGAIAGYCWGLPLVLSALTGMLPAHIQGAYSLGSLFTFAANTLLLCAALCEIPVLVFTLIAVGLVDIKTLKQYRRHTIVISFISGALLTPPDPLTQILVAIPLVALYEIGILAASLLLPHASETHKLSKTLSETGRSNECPQDNPCHQR